MTTPWPNTAKALLEARYNAFVKGDIEFIVQSHHPETRESLDRASLESWSKGSRWEGLSIESENVENEKTLITFVVRYSKGAETVNHREDAEFRIHDGRWHYFDSSFPKPQTIRREGEKLGRNDPCSCGSGKKFKKCHGSESSVA